MSQSTSEWQKDDGNESFTMTDISAVSFHVFRYALSVNDFFSSKFSNVVLVSVGVSMQGVSNTGVTVHGQNPPITLSTIVIFFNFQLRTSTACGFSSVPCHCWWGDWNGIRLLVESLKQMCNKHSECHGVRRRMQYHACTTSCTTDRKRDHWLCGTKTQANVVRVRIVWWKDEWTMNWSVLNLQVGHS